MEENCIDKLWPGDPGARPLAMFPSHQGKPHQAEISLHLTVESGQPSQILREDRYGEKSFN